MTPPPPTRMMNPLQCVNCIINYDWNIIETKLSGKLSKVDFILFSSIYIFQQIHLKTYGMVKPHVECFKGSLLLWNPMLKLHGDISHKKTIRFIVRWSPNKSNALYGWTYRLGGDAGPGPAPCLCIVELDWFIFLMEISWVPPWRLRWPTIRITSPHRSIKLRLLIPQYYSGWYMDFTLTDKHCTWCSDMNAKSAWFTVVIHVYANFIYYLVCPESGYYSHCIMYLSWHVHWLFINITDIYIHARVSKTLYCVFWDLLWVGILQTDIKLLLITLLVKFNLYSYFWAFCHWQLLSLNKLGLIIHLRVNFSITHYVAWVLTMGL